MSDTDALLTIAVKHLKLLRDILAIKAAREPRLGDWDWPSLAQQTDEILCLCGGLPALDPADDEKEHEDNGNE